MEVAGILAVGPLNADVDTLYDTKFYSVIDPSNQYNLPITYGTLVCLKTGGNYPTLQVCLNRSTIGDRIFYRTCDTSKVWGTWFSLT